MTETPAYYGPVPQSDFASQYNRILEAAGCRTQVELAAVLEVRQSQISDAKRRNLIPSAWFETLMRITGINPEWLRTGVGLKFLPHVVKIVETRPPEECSAQDLVDELVRRALEKRDIVAIQKEAAASWQPVDAVENSSGPDHEEF